MKRILITMVLLSMGVWVYGQSIFSGAEVTCVHFNLTVDEKISDQVLSQEETENAFKNLKFNQDWYTSQIIDTVYQIIETRLAEELDLHVAAVETLEGKVKYNPYGYPNTSLDKGVATGIGDYFIRLVVTMGSWSDKEKSLTLGDDVYQARTLKIKPVIAIRMVIADAKGNEVLDVRENYRSKDEIELSEKFVLGAIHVGETNNHVAQQHVLSSIVATTAEKLIEKARQALASRS